MGAERRRDARIRCNLPCTLRVAGSSLDGKVRNVSATGLAVAAETHELEQGDPATVTIRSEGSAIDVRALVWHVRTSGRNGGEKNPRVLGLVLSDSAPEFARLVERLTAKAPPASLESEPTPPPPGGSSAMRRSSPGAIARSRAVLERLRREPASAPAPLREYRIRIKQTGGPRTCQIVASGASKQAAIDAALREVGQGWLVLEAALIA